jgi:rhamnosyltransferase
VDYVKFAGVVTLYRPNEDVFDNIGSYLEELDILYVLDNSENPLQEVQKQMLVDKRIKYIAFHDNKGISYAMNYALKHMKDYDFLLTMDQDSKFFPGMMKKYKELVIKTETNNPGKIGVYSVNAGVDLTKMKARQTGQYFYRVVDSAITSGSIISINASMAIGGFDEKLFIDQVDIEFCYRMKKAGYQIVEFPMVMMYHTIGNISCHQIFSFKFNTYIHNAIRKYYIVRNQIYLSKRYPKFKWKCIWGITKQIIKVTIYEEDKVNKIKYIFKGIKDGILNRMGKMS